MIRETLLTATLHRCQYHLVTGNIARNRSASLRDYLTHTQLSQLLDFFVITAGHIERALTDLCTHGTWWRESLLEPNGASARCTNKLNRNLVSAAEPELEQLGLSPLIYINSPLPEGSAELLLGPVSLFAIRVCITLH